MQRTQEFLHLLSDGVSEASQQAWKSFLYNVDHVRLLGEAVSTEAALALIGGVPGGRAVDGRPAVQVSGSMS